MSREALMMRSRRSWCSSSSLRNVSNMGRYGDCVVGVGPPMLVSSMDDGLRKVMILSDGRIRIGLGPTPK